MLDDTSWYVPFIETCASEKLPWVTTPATYSYPGFPTIEEFTHLPAEYARQV